MSEARRGMWTAHQDGAGPDQWRGAGGGRQRTHEAVDDEERVVDVARRQVANLEGRHDRGEDDREARQPVPPAALVRRSEIGELWCGVAPGTRPPGGIRGDGSLPTSAKGSPKP